MNLINIAILFAKRNRLDTNFAIMNIAISFIFIAVNIFNTIPGNLFKSKPRRIPPVCIALVVLAFVVSAALFSVGLYKDINHLINEKEDDDDEDDLFSSETVNPDNEGGIIFESVTFALNAIYCVIAAVFCVAIQKWLKKVGVNGAISLDSDGGASTTTSTRSKSMWSVFGGDDDRNELDEYDDYLAPSSSRGVSFDYSMRGASFDFTRGSSIDIKRSPSGAAIINDGDDASDGEGEGEGEGGGNEESDRE